jgi:hypothetical protein
MLQKPDSIKPRGVFEVTLYDKDGNVKCKRKLNNGVVDVGINKLLDIMFGSDAKISTWYIGLISSSGYSGLSSSDTMGSHGGWTEFTGYSDTDRQAWTAGSASGKAISNASPVTVTANTSGTVKGFFISSDDTKGGTSGVLWATSLFADGDMSVVSSDVIGVVYTVSAS